MVQRVHFLKEYKNNNILKIELNSENINLSQIDYGEIIVENNNISNLSKVENLVVLECVNR